MLEDVTRNDLTGLINETDLDTVNEVNEFIDFRKPLQEQHVASVKLMVEWDGRTLRRSLRAS